MNLEKQMEEKRVGSIGFFEKSIGIPTAIKIAKQYAEEMCKKQRELCAGTYLHNTGSYMDSEAILISIENAPLATEEK